MSMTITSRAILALLLVAMLLTFAAVGGPSNGWDAAVAAWFAQLRASSPDAIHWSAAVTTIGGTPVTLGISLIATLWLLAKHKPRSAMLLATTVLLQRLNVELLKDLFGRPRPQVEDLPGSLAFPSGHATNSMTAFLTIALIAVPHRHRRLAILAALAITLAVGATRLVLGVHWASDVFGGWALGLLAVGLAVTISERSASIRLEAQHDVIARHGSPASEDESA
jgi:membrane-associated phospholipid phosphatase